MRYSLSTLRVFKVVADLGNITEAAEKLGRTPSTVSMALKNFEEELGVQLFKSERKNRLSPMGQFIRDQASDVISHYERAVASMQAYVRNQTGRVDLACVPSVAVSILPRVLLDFRGKYPGVEIDVRDADSPTVVEAVETGKVGLGVASIRRDQPEVHFEPLFRDALGIVCRADDPLAGASTPIAWDVIRERTLIGNGITGLIGSVQFSEMIRKAPITVYNVLSLLALVRAGVGVTVLPRLSIPASAPDLSFIALADPLARRTVGLLTRSAEVNLPATDAFARELRRVIRTSADELGLEMVNPAEAERSSRY